MSEKPFRIENRVIKIGLFAGVVAFAGLFAVGEVLADSVMLDNFENYWAWQKLSLIGYWGEQITNAAVAVSEFGAIKPYSGSLCGLWRMDGSERRAFISGFKNTYPYSGVGFYIIPTRIDTTGYIQIDFQGSQLWGKRDEEGLYFEVFVGWGPHYYKYRRYIDLNTYYHIQYQFEGELGNWQKCVSIVKAGEGPDWECFDDDLYVPDDGLINFIDFRGKFGYGATYGIDDIHLDNFEIVPPDLRVWGVSPESGSAITDLETDFTFAWEGWDEWYQSVYGKLSLNFYNKKTGIGLPSVIFEPPAESGQYTLKFGDFDLVYSGEWHLYARAISGYPYYFMTTDLISPEYWVNIDIAELPPIFEMPDWGIWYGENVERFDEPTAVFSGIVGFLGPVYSHIGAFGEGVIEFLDYEEARATGENLAIAIPLFRHYVSEIEALWGGFPIIKMFLMMMIFLIGLFVVKLILKFIPTLG